MSNERTFHQSAPAFINYLGRYRNDRGALAHLRGGLSESRRPRAWPLLGGFSEQAIGTPAYEVVAALWAYAPELAADDGNMGQTLRHLITSKEATASMEIRFRRLLACTKEEIPERVAPMVRMAQGKEQRIAYVRLLSDLLWWNERVRIEWARSFWRVQEGAVIGEVA